MLTLDQIESGVQCTHKNTKLRYSVVEVGDDEVLLSPESTGMQDLVVPVDAVLPGVRDRRPLQRPRARQGGRRGKRARAA